MGFLWTKEKPNKKTPDELVREARGGNDESRERLIRAFIPFALRVTAQAAGRRIDPDVDDEFSVALLALNEAVDSFEPERGVAFLGFAETVIRRRLIDFFRREANRRRREVPLTSFEEENEEGSVINPLEAVQAAEAFVAASETEARREEIFRYRQVLASYGITMADLVRSSPRHEDARRRAIAAARMVAGSTELVKYLKLKKELPLKLLSGEVEVSRKTLERQRKYIIAVVLVLIEDFEYLREYVLK